MRIDQLDPKPSDAEPLEIPPELLNSVMRHQAHLMALIATMRAAGLEEDMVDTSVRSLVDSYANELAIAIREMMKGQRHG